jgi:hypothetical protein
VDPNRSTAAAINYSATLVAQKSGFLNLDSGTDPWLFPNDPADAPMVDPFLVPAPVGPNDRIRLRVNMTYEVSVPPTGLLGVVVCLDPALVTPAAQLAAFPNGWFVALPLSWDLANAPSSGEFAHWHAECEFLMPPGLPPNYPLQAGIVISGATGTIEVGGVDAQLLNGLTTCLTVEKLNPLASVPPNGQFLAL